MTGDDGRSRETTGDDGRSRLRFESSLCFHVVCGRVRGRGRDRDPTPTPIPNPNSNPNPNLRSEHAQRALALVEA